MLLFNWKKKEISIVDKDKTLNKKGKEWIKLLTMQIWCVNEEEAYTFPNLKDLHFYQNQPQLKNALKILNAHMPLYKLIIQKENEEMDKTGQFQKLQKDNKKKEKLIKEKDKLIQDKYR